jgi:hypothetical protein
MDEGRNQSFLTFKWIQSGIIKKHQVFGNGRMYGFGFHLFFEAGHLCSKSIVHHCWEEKIKLWLARCFLHCLFLLRKPEEVLAASRIDIARRLHYDDLRLMEY